MVLRRLGNKTKIAAKIYQHFPKHDMYIEPFFGAGGMFFNKPKASHNILNDIDSDVFNLFQVINNRYDELEAMFLTMPYSEDLWRYWKTNKEEEPVRKALRFLFLSNYGLFGKNETMRFMINNTSKVLLDNLKKTHKIIFDCQFMNADFREMFAKITYSRKLMDRRRAFIYADPPYLSTTNNYSQSFTEQDSIDLFDTLQSTKIKWAMSEFDNPFILNQAKERNLNVIVIGERNNLNNRRTEILITNYNIENKLF